MYSTSVIERVKQGLTKESLQMLSSTASRSSDGSHQDMLLHEFLENALRELGQQKPFRKQLMLRIGADGIVPLPSNVISVESVWHKGNRLVEKESAEGLTTSEYHLDISAKIIRVATKLTGTIVINSTIIPREEDVTGQAKRTLVLHVKAQCCEYIAQALQRNPSLRFSKARESMNDPGIWEREAQILQQRFAEALRTVG